MNNKIKLEKEDLIQFLVDNKSSFSIYSALELLEQVFELPLERIELNQLELKGNPSISVSSDDLHSVKKTTDRLILCINNVSLVGLQGPMPMRYAEELLQLIQEGDQVLQSFLDFFNHRIIQNLYRIRKSCYLQFYAPALFQDLYFLFTEKKRFKSHEGFTILASKISSAFVLQQIIAQIVGPETTIIIHKGIGKWIKSGKTSFPCRLGKIFLGEKIWVNEILVVNLKCSSQAQYEMLINNNVVKDVVAEYSNSYEIRVFLERVKYRQIFLGSYRLLLGICL